MMWELIKGVGRWLVKGAGQQRADFQAVSKHSMDLIELMSQEIKDNADRQDRSDAKIAKQTADLAALHVEHLQCKRDHAIAVRRIEHLEAKVRQLENGKADKH